MILAVIGGESGRFESLRGYKESRKSAILAGAGALPSLRTTAILERLRKKYPTATYVFQYERAGKTLRIGNPRKAFQSALKRARIKPCGGDDFTIHDCRHHFASRLAQKGATLTEIRDLLGHADIKMTLRYSHLCRGNLDRAVALLD